MRTESTSPKDAISDNLVRCIPYFFIQKTISASLKFKKRIISVEKFLHKMKIVDIAKEEVPKLSGWKNSRENKFCI